MLDAETSVLFCHIRWWIQPSAISKYIFFKLLQFANVFSRISVTFWGIVISVSAVQPLKALLRIVVTPLPILNEASDVQLQNAPEPIT